MEPDICEHSEKKNNNGFVTDRILHSGTKEEMNSYIQKSTSENQEQLLTLVEIKMILGSKYQQSSTLV